MVAPKKSLLRTRRFGALFLTQSLIAFNNNLYKNALLILITYSAIPLTSMSMELIVVIAAGLFIFPFFLFSATAGQLADKFDKARLIQIIKATEIVLIIGVSLGLYFQNIIILMSQLFLIGTLSAFFGPIKYSILPEQLQRKELLQGNGLIEAGTFLAILLGTICGSMMILGEHGRLYVSLLLLACAIVGFISSLYIPQKGPAAQKLKINANFLKETVSIIRYASGNRTVFYSIIAISWFWFIGATFLSQFPIYARTVLHANAEVVTLFLSVFSIGIAIGSTLCARLSKGTISVNYAGKATVGMGVGTLFFVVFSLFQPAAQTSSLAGFVEFITQPLYWPILMGLFIVAISGGIYIVPLYALLQAKSDKSHLSRVIAVNNILNALFMVLSAIISAVVFSLHYTATDLFFLLSILIFISGILIKKIS